MRVRGNRFDPRGPLVGLALACAAALLVARWSAGADAAAPVVAAAAPRMPLRTGDEPSFEFRAVADVEVALAGEPMPQRVRSIVEAKLRLRVFAADRGSAELGVCFDAVRRLTDGARDEAADRRLASPFVARIAADGRFAEFTFPPSLPDEDRRQVAEWLRMFEVVLGPDAGDRWRTEQTHETGTYVARCERSNGSIERRKLRYETGSGERRVQVDASVLRAALAEDGSWLDRAELHEELNLRDAGGFAARVTTTAELRRGRARAEAFVADTAAATVAGAESRLVVLLASPAPVPATPADRAGFAALLHGLAAAQRVDPAVLHALRDLLRADPELAGLVHEALRRARLGGLGAGIALHALELAANGPAQRTLVAIAADPVVAGADRLRSLVAIGGAGAAGADVRERLWQIHDDRADPPARERAATALLALGAIGNALRGSRTADYDLLRGRLAGTLQAAMDPPAAVTALQAIGNTGDPELAPAVALHLAAKAPVERAAAARALARLGEPRATVELAGVLQTEPDGAVRAEIVGSLAALGDADPRTIESLERRIAEEPDPGCRLAMARYLVPHLDRRAGLRESLAALLRREHDQRVSKLISASLAGL